MAVQGGDPTQAAQGGDPTPQGGDPTQGGDHTVGANAADAAPRIAHGQWRQWAHPEDQAVDAADHLAATAIARAAPPSGWSAHWEDEQCIVYYEHDISWWRKYPAPGDLMPEGPEDWYCHTCQWPMRDQETDCWFCRGRDTGVVVMVPVPLMTANTTATSSDAMTIVPLPALHQHHVAADCCCFAMMRRMRTWGS